MNWYIGDPILNSKANHEGKKRKMNGRLRAHSFISEPLGICFRGPSSAKKTIPLHRTLSARPGRRPVGTKRIRQWNFVVKYALLGQ